MHDNMTIADIGMEVITIPIVSVRLHRVDKQWLVEYRRKPQWFFDKWWWFNDGKYVYYNDAVLRAEILTEFGSTTETKYKKQTTYKVKK
jgi:hypothetical protein